jgi:3-oxoacyl-[acyl-carrier protein] reductase
MKGLKDKTILITGGGRGIGKRLAIGLAQQGARIGLLARSKAELDLASLEIEHGGGTSLRIRADVRDPEQILAAVDRLRVHFGPVTCLVCAAGVQGPIGPMWEAPVREWKDALETNVLGVLHACRAVIPGMAERRQGKILILGGNGALKPRPFFSAYATSKAALARLAENLAEETMEFNIQVNCMMPGSAYTSMTDEILQAGDRAGWREQEEARLVRQNGGTPADKQIQLASFLLSERSNHVSGKMIQVSDDWRKLEQDQLNPEVFTLRRVQKV